MTVTKDLWWLDPLQNTSIEKFSNSSTVCSLNESKNKITQNYIKM